MDVHDRWRPFLIYEMLAKGLGVHFSLVKCLPMTLGVHFFVVNCLPMTLGVQSEVSGDSS